MSAVNAEQWRLTSAGAFNATCLPDPSPLRGVLWRLLVDGRGGDARLGPAGDAEVLLELQNRRWIVPDTEAAQNVAVDLERAIPQLLNALSPTGMAVLAEQRGLVIGHVGFSASEAGTLAAISADVLALSARVRSLGVTMGDPHPAEAWGVIDPGGVCRTGFWPLYLPSCRFSLIVVGRPMFYRNEFARLVHLLARRW